MLSEHMVLPDLLDLDPRPTPWDTLDGRRALADYLASVNDGVSVRGAPGLIGRIKRLLSPLPAPAPDSTETMKLPLP